MAVDRAALRWDFAAPHAANFHDGGPCVAAWGLRRVRRGKLPWRWALPRRVWDFAATPPGERDALRGRTGACRSPSPRRASRAGPEVTKQYQVPAPGAVQAARVARNLPRIAQQQR